MTTTNVIRGYFESLERKQDWQSFLAEQLAFTSFTSPIKRTAGKSAYLESTKRFFSMITKVQLEDLLVDGSKACALTRYQLQAPGRAAFECPVAEVFEVRDGMIASLQIYFDSSPFPR